MDLEKAISPFHDVSREEEISFYSISIQYGEKKLNKNDTNEKLTRKIV